MTKEEINAMRPPSGYLWTRAQEKQNALCDLALQSLSLESVRSEAQSREAALDDEFLERLRLEKLAVRQNALEEAAKVCDLYALAERSADDTSAGMWNAGPYVKCALAIRALQQSPARVAEEKDVHSTELRK